MPTPVEQLLARTVYEGDGVTTSWEFSFSGGYLDQDHVKAYTEDSNGARTELTVLPGDFTGEFTLDLGVVPIGERLVIYRDTPKDLPLVNFVDGARFTEAAMDTVAKQAVFVAAEVADILESYTVVADAALAAELSADDAEAAAASALASWDSLDDRYLGAKASAPTLDNDGNALVEGALYWNSVSNLMFSWDGAAWAAAYANLGDAVLKAGDAMTGTLTTTGSIGVGTSSPLYKLVVSNAGANGLEIDPVGGVGGGTSLFSYNRSGAVYTRMNLYAADFSWLVSGTEVGVIDTAGRFGIGTNTPADSLHVQGTEPSVSATQLTLEARYSGYGAGVSFQSRTSSGGTRVEMARITADGEDAWNTTASTQDAGLRFFTAADGVTAERMRISSDGNVAIGTATATSNRLIVKGSTADNTANGFVVADSVGSALLQVRNDGAFYTGTSGYSPYNVTTASAANAFVFNTGLLARSTSSIKYKEDVRDYTRGITEVMALRPVFYKSKGSGDIARAVDKELDKLAVMDAEKGELVKPDKLPKDYVLPVGPDHAGFIAEEVHAAGLTEFVQYAEDGTPDALGYSHMTALFCKAIQEQQAQIVSQQALIVALTARVDALEAKEIKP